MCIRDRVYSASTVSSESATISITQLIYDGGRTIAAIRSAKEADIAGRATLLRDLQTLALNIANAYYTVLEDNATVTADAQLVHEFEVNEASVAAQIRNGAAPRSDIAAAQFQTCLLYTSARPGLLCSVASMCPPSCYETCGMPLTALGTGSGAPRSTLFRETADCLPCSESPAPCRFGR